MDGSAQMSRNGHKYLAKAIDTVKLVLDKTGKDVQVGVPEHMPTNKIRVFTQFNVKQSKVCLFVLFKIPCHSIERSVNNYVERNAFSAK